MIPKEKIKVKIAFLLSKPSTEGGPPLRVGYLSGLDSPVFSLINETTQMAIAGIVNKRTDCAVTFPFRQARAIVSTTPELCPSSGQSAVALSYQEPSNQYGSESPRPSSAKVNHSSAIIIKKKKKDANWFDD